jgi:hypothetical protein
VSDFVSTEIAVADSTAVRLVSAAQFNRALTISADGTTRFAFTSGAASTGIKVSALGDHSNAIGRFTLPAGEEAWVWQNSGGSINVQVLATAIAR